MSKPFISMTLPVTEMAKFNRWVYTQKRETVDKCENIVHSVIRDVEAKAKSLSPVNHGFLRGSIHSEFSDLGGSVFTAKKYAPYREWGTGNRINVPSFVKEMFGVDSMDWKGEGIREVNTKPHPYLFSAARIGYISMIHQLRAIGFDKETSPSKTTRRPTIFTNL